MRRAYQASGWAASMSASGILRLSSARPSADRPRGDEVAIGGAHGALAELGQPGPVRQPLGELFAFVGDAPALGGPQQTAIALGDRIARERPHDLEDLGGVLLVSDQAPDGPKRPQRLQVEGVAPPLGRLTRLWLTEHLRGCNH
jgi:hypothetical protein